MAGNGDKSWCISQIKGALDDDGADADFISCVEFNHDGELLATGDKGGRVVIFQVHEYLRSKLWPLYDKDCIFDKFECCWNASDTSIMTGTYNNFFRVFDRNTIRELTLEASREIMKPKMVSKPRKVCTGGKPKKDEISVDCLDFNKKILHGAWHPLENIIAVAATNNLFIFHDQF